MLVILAAVSISAVYNSNIVNYAVNGATNYASEATRENEILDQTASIIQNAVDRISNITGGSSGETPNPGGDDGEDPVTPPDEPDPGINFGDLTEEEMNAMVGKYVDYTPVNGSFTAEAQYTGYDVNQNFSTVTSLKWRILDANNNTLTLISDKVANTEFILGGQNGYNNGVLLLNNACAAMYSNSSLGTTGRSLNIDDIEMHSNYKGATLEESTITDPEYMQAYPDIFAKELNGAPNRTYGTELDLSEQDEYILGASAVKSFKGKQTYYTFTMSTSTMDNQTYVNLFSSSTVAWLASRCVDLHISYAYFMVFRVNGNSVSSNDLCSSLSGNNSPRGAAIRPVVEIDLSKVNVGLTGDGGADTPFSIEAK